MGPNHHVILATPPAFRLLHFEYAVEKGRNVFMEKSFAVDAPGIQRLLKAGRQAAKKNLKVAGGLMMRHDVPLTQAIVHIYAARSAISVMLVVPCRAPAISSRDCRE